MVTDVAKATEVAERAGSMDIAGRFEASKTSSVMDIATEVELTMTVAIANVSVVDGTSKGATESRSAKMICNAVAKTMGIACKEIIVTMMVQKSTANDITQNLISISLLLAEFMIVEIAF